MKLLIIFAFTFLSLLALATDVKDFNRALLQDVKKEASDTTNEHYRKTAPIRGPASVGGPEKEAIHSAEEKKIDKMNIKQLGPSKW